MILDGSVGQALEPHLRSTARADHPPTCPRSLDVSVSALGDEAPLLGAIAAALELVRADEASAGVLAPRRGRARAPADGGDPAPSRVAIDVRDRIMDAFDADHALELLRTVVCTPSPAGDEFFLAGVVAGELHALGFEQVAFDRFAPSGATAPPGSCAARGGGEETVESRPIWTTAGVDGSAERWRGDEREDAFAGGQSSTARLGPRRGRLEGRARRDAGGACGYSPAPASGPVGTLILTTVADRHAAEPPAHR